MAISLSCPGYFLNKTYSTFSFVESFGNLISKCCLCVDYIAKQCINILVSLMLSFVLLLIFVVQCCSLVIDSQHFSEFYFNFGNPPNEPLQGNLILRSPFDLCSSSKDEGIENIKVVMFL